MEPRDSADFLDIESPINPLLVRRAEEVLLVAMQEGTIAPQSVNVALNILALGAEYNWS